MHYERFSAGESRLGEAVSHRRRRISALSAEPDRDVSLGEVIIPRLWTTAAIALISVLLTAGIAHAKQGDQHRAVTSKPAVAAHRMPKPRSWVSSAVAVVLRTGAFPGATEASLLLDEPLDQAMLQTLLTAAFPAGAKRTRQLPAGQAVTVGDVDAAFVLAAGLEDTATRAQQLINAAGYVARPGVGTEIVARLLRLRTNLAQGDDLKEHAWYQQATRSDAIWSAAQAIGWGGWEQPAASDAVELLGQLPPTTGPQHAAIQRAFDFIGMPYVWGGTSERPQILFGANTSGGFDCSGFTWRVLALDATSPKAAAKAFGGRTTFEMAAKAKPAQRLAATEVLPADILLFGPGGRQASSGSIGHTGMAISSALFIQSSGQGIALARWDTGYYQSQFAFGKRILS